MAAYFVKVTKLVSKNSFIKAVEEEFEGKSSLIQKSKKDIEEIYAKN